MSNDARRERALDAAWDALDQGDAEQALRAVRALEREDGDRCLVEVHAQLTLGDLHAAREALARAREDLDGDDLLLLWAGAELALASWDLQGARRGLEACLEQEESPEACERLALVHDLLGDPVRADRLRDRAHALAPEDVPAPVRIAPDAFDAVVEAALSAMAPRFRAALANVVVVRAAVPDLDLVDPRDPLAVPGDLLGLFVGENALERSEEAPWSLPATIHLFQRNLERVCTTHAQLEEQIRVTLYHEVGHLLGLDEEGVDALGLG